MGSWFPPFAKNAKDGAPTVLVMPARLEAWATRRRHSRLPPFVYVNHLIAVGREVRALISKHHI
jgi:hypothetical protein